MRDAEQRHETAQRQGGERTGTATDLHPHLVVCQIRHLEFLRGLRQRHQQLAAGQRGRSFQCAGQ